MEKVIAKVEREVGERNFSCYMSVKSVHAGVSREIGISSAVMRQYATGARKPSQERKEQIVKGIKALAKKIESVSVS